METLNSHFQLYSLILADAKFGDKSHSSNGKTTVLLIQAKYHIGSYVLCMKKFLWHHLESA
jgi:hypothetical protein